MTKVAFCLMGLKGYYTLEKIIIEFGAEIIDCIVSSKDNNIKNDYYEEIRKICKKNNIPFYSRTYLPNLSVKTVIAISWRWIIPSEKDKSIIVLHDSLLPKYRGFAPLVSQLINGEKEIGVTALFANEKYDTGHIIAQKNVSITYPIKINKVIEIICPLYFHLTKDIVKKIISGKKIISKAQNENNATYSLWRDSDDYKINWDLDSSAICRFVDAVGYPYSGAFTYMENKKIIINDVEEVPDLIIENRTPGKIIFFNNIYPVVVCRKGLLMIKNAVFAENQKPFLPISKFRIRFS